MGHRIMEVELQEIRDFVAVVPPFDLLPENELNLLVRKLGIRYIRRGKSLSENAETSASLFIIRQGSVSLYSVDNKLFGMLAEVLSVRLIVQMEETRPWMPGQQKTHWFIAFPAMCCLNWLLNIPKQLLFLKIPRIED